MVYSHWLTPGPGPRPRPGLGRMGCMILCRTFHITLGLGQDQDWKKHKWVLYPFFRSWKSSWWWVVTGFSYNIYIFCTFSLSSAVKMAPTCRNILTKCTKIQKNKDLMNLYWCYLMWDLWIINRDIWVHPMNVERSLKGEFYTHYADLCYYEDRFFEFYQMTTQQFDYILERIVPLITKKHSNFWSPISAEQKLVLKITWVLFKLLVRNEFSLLHNNTFNSA